MLSFTHNDTSVDIPSSSFMRNLADSKGHLADEHVSPSLRLFFTDRTQIYTGTRETKQTFIQDMIKHGYSVLLIGVMSMLTDCQFPAGFLREMLDYYKDTPIEQTIIRCLRQGITFADARDIDIGGVTMTAGSVDDVALIAEHFTVKILICHDASAYSASNPLSVSTLSILFDTVEQLSCFCMMENRGFIYRFNNLKELKCIFSDIDVAPDETRVFDTVTSLMFFHAPIPQDAFFRRFTQLTHLSMDRCKLRPTFTQSLPATVTSLLVDGVPFDQIEHLPLITEFSCNGKHAKKGWKITPQSAPFSNITTLRLDNCQTSAELVEMQNLTSLIISRSILPKKPCPLHATVTHLEITDSPNVKLEHFTALSSLRLCSKITDKNLAKYPLCDTLEFFESTEAMPELFWANMKRLKKMNLREEDSLIYLTPTHPLCDTVEELKIRGSHINDFTLSHFRRITHLSLHQSQCTLDFLRREIDSRRHPLCETLQSLTIDDPVGVVSDSSLKHLKLTKLFVTDPGITLKFLNYGAPMLHTLRDLTMVDATKLSKWLQLRSLKADRVDLAHLAGDEPYPMRETLMTLITSDTKVTQHLHKMTNLIFLQVKGVDVTKIAWPAGAQITRTVEINE